MTRLTTSLKDSIVENALSKSGYPERLKAYTLQRAAWADAVRKDAIGKDAEKLDALSAEVEKIRAKVPKAFRDDSGSPVNQRGRMWLNCAGASIYVSEWEGQKVCPSQHTLTAAHPLAIEWTRLESINQDLGKERENLRRTVRAALNSVTTVARLMKLWPEVKELLPPYIEESKDQLPTIQVSDLNKLVGLPTENATE